MRWWVGEGCDGRDLVVLVVGLVVEEEVMMGFGWLL